MSGGFIGLRSGSYGSLQAQGNGASSPGVALPILSPPPALPSSRKGSKMLLAGSRDKERRLPWIFKLACRRRVAMLLLLLVSSAAVFLSCFSILSRDYDAQLGSEMNLRFSDHVRHVMNTATSSPDMLWQPSVTDEDTNKVESSPLLLSSVQFPLKSENETDEDESKVDPLPRSLSDVQFLVRSENETLNDAFPHRHYDFPAQHPCGQFSFPPPPSDRKRTGPRPCPVCYVPVEYAVAAMPTFPSPSPVLENLSYVSDEYLLLNDSNEGSLFGGLPSLHQRNESYDIRETMTVHCGFVKGNKPGHGTGFDMDDDDLLEMERCHGVVVASAIFGNYDIMQQPKGIGGFSKRSVCFYMFVDEETEAYIKNTSVLDNTMKVGLWRVVVVRNLPYADARRNGKIPKLLLHRIFPHARFSIWIDGKLKLVVDPYRILERFLWRENATFAISKHYKRFDVFEEAEANKAAGKYDNASIDYQLEFYRREGLTHYTEDKLPISSDVPEGCVILREHIPITNLFTCLWFNEVNRFTSRDQLSFSTVRDKIMSKVDWSINMFLDCERRNFVVQAYHKDLLEQRNLQLPFSYPPPRSSSGEQQSSKPSPDALRRGVSKPPPLRKPPVKHGKDKKSNSKRHRPRPLISREFVAN
ncbi:uncharacterized protein LOC120258374 [Dioscorea cayenensis subsp. rotundata]|uniref:Uncharacterized protein LOC120258374 n=1 Tax=Dioscorea cayennensis subsp. rotundata TaxID=55577 RepID=A0AB40B2Y7_DIOCR|nr:uncharacterized protein LOC120258374 [Dioscorea cayenensis subsp. rotundata]